MTAADDDAHRRPEGATDADVAAAGALAEALETVHRARGALHDFHQLIGSAELKLDVALAALRRGGHDELAGAVRDELVGRNVIDGCWSFQVIVDDVLLSSLPWRCSSATVPTISWPGSVRLLRPATSEHRRPAGEPRSVCPDGHPATERHATQQ